MTESDPAPAAAPAPEPGPTMIPKSLGFFSEWYVQVIWPSGKKDRIDGFENEAHARGWIAQESAAWIEQAKKPRRW